MCESATDSIKKEKQKVLAKKVLEVVEIHNFFKYGKIPCLGPFFVFGFFQTTSRRNFYKNKNNGLKE